MSNKRVDRLLEHPLLVVDDDLGGSEVEQALEPVVAVDHPPVEVVEVGGGEPPTIELHHRPQVGWDDGDGLEDHVPRLVLPLVERLDHLDPLRCPLTLLRRSGQQVLSEPLHLAPEVEPAEEVLDRLGPHPALVVAGVPVGDLPPQLLGLDELLGLHRAEGVEGVLDQLGLALRPLLAVADLTLDLFAAGGDLLALGATLFHLGELGLEPLETGLLPGGELLMNDLDLGPHGLLELGQVLLAPGVINVGDEIGGEVDDLLELLR